MYLVAVLAHATHVARHIFKPPKSSLHQINNGVDVKSSDCVSPIFYRGAFGKKERAKKKKEKGGRKEGATGATLVRGLFWQAAAPKAIGNKWRHAANMHNKTSALPEYRPPARCGG